MAKTGENVKKNVYAITKFTDDKFDEELTAEDAFLIAINEALGELADKGLLFASGEVAVLAPNTYYALPEDCTVILSVITSTGVRYNAWRVDGNKIACADADVFTINYRPYPAEITSLKTPLPYRDMYFTAICDYVKYWIYTFDDEESTVAPTWYQKCMAGAQKIYELLNKNHSPAQMQVQRGNYVVGGGGPVAVSTGSSVLTEVKAAANSAVMAANEVKEAVDKTEEYVLSTANSAAAAQSNANSAQSSATSANQSAIDAKGWAATAQGYAANVGDKNTKLNMIGVWPWKYTGLLRKKTLTFSSGNDYLQSLAFDGKYIYAGMITAPARIVKVDPLTMTEVATLTLTIEEEHSCYTLTFDGTYLYAGLLTAPAMVVKIDPATMTQVGSTLTLANEENYCSALITDGNYLYAGLGAGIAKIVKIDPTTMTPVDSALTLRDVGLICGLTFDGMYIYAAFTGWSGWPTMVLKLDPITMTQVGSTLKLAITQADGGDIITDGTYIYVGVFSNPAEIVKIDPNTMTPVATLTLALDEGYCDALTFDGTYLYAGLYTNPGRVVKIDPATMTQVGSTFKLDIFEYEERVISLIFDGTYLYAGLYTNPAKLVQRDLYTTFQEKHIPYDEDS